MRSMVARFVQILTALTGIGLTLILSRFLPDRVATHFAFSGEPNAWSSNLINTIFFCVTFLIVNLLFLAIPWLLKKLPVGVINMPNREYWLAPERRQASVTKVGTHMAVFAGGVNFFLTAVELLSFYANRAVVPMPAVGLITTAAGFLLFLIFWVIRFTRAFRLPAA